MRAPLMHHMAEALAHHHIATLRYDYPYSHRLQDGYTEDLIDPLDVLLATTRAAIHAAQDLAPGLPLFLAGRSMSAQVISLLLAREPCPHVRGLICYVYPNRWHALLQDTLAHLPQVPVPILFIQGARDPEYCDLAHLQPALDNLVPKATLHVIQDADHAFHLPPQSTRTQQDAIRESATTSAIWIHHQLKPIKSSAPSSLA